MSCTAVGEPADASRLSSSLAPTYQRRLTQAPPSPAVSHHCTPRRRAHDLALPDSLTIALPRPSPSRPPQLYHTSAHQEDVPAALDEPPVLVSPDRPSQEQQIEVLNAALAEGLRQERAAKQAARRPWL